MDEKIKKEVMDILLGEETKTLKKRAKIIHSKQQYSVKIPLSIAKHANIDPKKHEMEFEAIPNEEGTQFTIKAKVVNK